MNMREKKPVISIVVPTYNRVNLLKEAVDSILAQTFKEFELIIIDNMSQDATESYAGSLKDPRIRYFRNQNNGIIAVNRNFGIRKAEGTYIALCDDDDIWLPEKLEKQLNTFETNTGLLLVSSNALIFGNTTTIDNRSTYLTIKKDTTLSFKEILLNNLVINSSILMKASVIENIGFIDENPDIKAFEDFDFWTRILRFKDRSIHILREPLIKYRVHGSNIYGTNKMDAPLVDPRYMLVFGKHQDNFHDFIEKAIRKIESREKVYRYAVSMLNKPISYLSLLRNRNLSTFEKLLVLRNYLQLNKKM